MAGAKIRVGIPRGLFYYRYFSFWKTFFEELGVEVVVSPATDEKIVEQGIKRLTNEICLPIKTFCGHTVSLGNCDFIFIPSIYSLEKKVYNCPKFIGLPDLMRAAIPESPPILDPDINLDKGKLNFYRTLYSLGQRFTLNPLKIKKAIDSATKSQTEFEKRCVAVKEKKGDGKVRIALIAHPYIVFDSYLNHRLLSHLERMGVDVVHPQMVEPKKLRTYLYHIIERPYWTCEDEILGAGAYFLESEEVTGLISVNAFGCGPDSVMLDLLQNYAQKQGKPFLQIVLDEHTGEAGVVTRVEAFIDTIYQTNNKKTRVFPAVLSHKFASDERDERIESVGLPYLGGRLLTLREITKENLGISLISPQVSERTVELGVRYSPEWVCFPFKVILGTFIECIEQGADTLLMATSFNACRMGRYARVQEQILANLGYKFRFLKVHSKNKGVSGVLRTIKRFTRDVSWLKIVSFYRLGVEKLRALDEIEREVQRTRAWEMEKGMADRILERAREVINSASTFQELKDARDVCLEKLKQIPRDVNANPLRVGMVGELYVLMEPFCNMNIESELGKMGVEVTRVRSTFFSEYTRSFSFDTLNEEKRKLQRFTYKYLKRDVGGHGLESLGKKITWAGECDGIVHLMPFGCMPEVIAQNIMLKTEEKIPVLTIACDEKLGKAGLITRLEAFVDLLEIRRKHQTI